jgi:hypothetical protein
MPLGEQPQERLQEQSLDKPQPLEHHLQGQVDEIHTPPALPLIAPVGPPAPAELLLRSADALPAADEAAASGSPSRLATLVAMAQLLREAGRPLMQQEHAAFIRLRSIALHDLQQGSNSLQGCCQLLQASARADVPLAPQELAVFEAAAVPCLVAAEATASHLLQLWSAYTQLGMQPGSNMAAALVEAAEPCIAAGGCPATPRPAPTASEVRRRRAAGGSVPVDLRA